ncbi:MAG TPA: hypothetical protein VGH38_06430 [Bryobacteraceae bacterium]|jgi:hypothetical protein
MSIRVLNAVFCLFLGTAVSQTVYAQSVTRISRNGGRTGAAAGLAPTTAERAPSGQYSAHDLEDLRSQLVSLADTIQDFGAMAPPQLVDLDGLAQARSQIQQMPYKDLNSLRQGLSPSKINTRISMARQSVAVYAKAMAEYKSSAVQMRPLSDSTTLPNATGSCESIAKKVFDAIGIKGVLDPGTSPAQVSRIPVEVVLAADVIFFIADSVRELAQDGCKQEAVFAGEGGNTSTVCIITDIIWIIAKAVDDGIHFCDDDLTGNVIDANYARLSDVHDDIVSADDHVSNVDTHISTVATNVATAFTALDTHVTNVDTRLTASLTTLQSSVVLVQGSLANLQASQSNNQALNFRLAIEQELLQAGRGGLGMLELPASAGGYLEQVRQVVADTIQKFRAAGQSVGSADTSMSLADDAVSRKDYKAAFTSYRDAYRLAVQ